LSFGFAVKAFDDTEAVADITIVYATNMCKNYIREKELAV
jgi:hypothetical protein